MQILPEIEIKDGRPIEEPAPRYAHQVVYDSKTRTIFMHGGNAGIGVVGMERSSGSGMDGEGVEDSVESGEGSDRDQSGKERRLDDLWCMKLHRFARFCHYCPMRQIIADALEQTSCGRNHQTGHL